MREKIEQGMKVATSANMAPPPVEDMFARRPYRTRPDAPATHARLCKSEDGKGYCLNYNGVDLITFSVPEHARCGMRAHSDGDFQSRPFIQQFLAWSREPVRIEVTFASPVEMWNVRPRRAQDGEAILGELGAPLLYGVNGLYLPDWDLLVSWHGAAFSWVGDRVERDAAGRYIARMSVALDGRPIVVLIRPHYYSEHLGYAEYRPWDFRPNPKPITGWCSWEAYHSSVRQEDLARDAQSLQTLRPYGLTYMQLDDGFQQPLIPPEVGDGVPKGWLELNERFPDGHAGITSAIRNAGFEPGIWTNVVLNNREAADALNVCLRDSNGELIRGDWIVHVLDCLPRTLREQVTPYYRKFREFGYTYFKSDALRHLIYDGLQEAVRLGVLEPEDARGRMRAYMEAARAGIGPDAYYLSCWGVLSQSIGVCDAMRVATDANPSWSAYSMQLRETARWFFAQRVLFTLDPDHVCVRGDLKWVRMMLSLVSLTGGLLMISDKPDLYDAPRLSLMRKTMPATAVHAGETGPIDYTTPACTPIPNDEGALDEASAAYCHIDDSVAPFSSLWCVHFDQGGRRWAVAQRAAVVPLKPLDLSVERLALDPGRRYYVYHFWHETGAFVEDGVLRLGALSLGDTDVLGITDVTDGVPTLLASDRHVTMDAVSVERQSYSEGTFELALKGFEGLEARYLIYAPNLAGECACAEGARVHLDRQGEVIAARVKFENDRAILRIR